MPKSRNQKLKLLCLKDILEKYTDDNNKLSTKEIIDKLAEYGISAERKSIYDDIECLKYYGLDIITEKTDSNRYFIGERTFELPELKLLVDSVQSSKILTVKKSDSLIKKLKALGDKATNALKQGIMAGCLLVERDAKLNVKSNTGALRDTSYVLSSFLFNSVTEYFDLIFSCCL